MVDYNNFSFLKEFYAIIYPDELFDLNQYISEFEQPKISPIIYEHSCKSFDKIKKNKKHIIHKYNRQQIKRFIKDEIKYF